jgi:hypothetical protein
MRLKDDYFLCGTCGTLYSCGFYSQERRAPDALLHFHLHAIEIDVRLSCQMVKLVGQDIV